ncbi:PglL family O-oligosaccharyltransferase [Klebsiella aerogenes]|uniref:PglL family O-oligosaccharyltransferase n=1 Tax=Klebsiella aerogenes TaxID=548 RepID=UPI001BD2831C|nr:Wzy polymerase domain-containing protein [Klebsiella aerogenes]
MMMGKTKKISMTRKNTLFMLGGLTLYWLLFLHIGWKNSGGWGSDLPYNLLGWGFILSLCTLFWVFFSDNLIANIGVTGKYIVIGAALMTLPMLWSPTFATLINALPRLMGMWGGLLFWGTLRQCRFSSRQRTWLLYCLAVAGMIEAAIVLIELYAHPVWLPTIWQTIVAQFGRYATGVFQQINLTASFLATGLAAVLLLTGLRAARLENSTREKWRMVLLAVGCVLISTVLTLASSRTGWLAGLAVVASLYYLLNFSPFRHQGHQQPLLLALPLIGILVGLALMPYSAHQALLMHQGSNHQRLLTLYYTFLYAIQPPILGYGAGTYEGAYQHYLAMLPGGNPGLETMSHPHNELLYQYAEGGFIALTGALVWLGLVVRVWRKADSALYRGIIICMLPIMLHTQLEYPLYYSVPHYLVLLMLLSLAEKDEPQAVENTSRASTPVFRYTMLLLTFYGALVSFQSYRVWQTLERFEASSLADPEVITALNVPGVMRLRYEQDLTLLRLFRFRHEKDLGSLREFTEENAIWMSVHAWPVLYQNQISVLRYLNDAKNVALWQEQAQRTFPWDKRFQVIKAQTTH